MKMTDEQKRKHNIDMRRRAIEIFDEELNRALSGSYCGKVNIAVSVKHGKIITRHRIIDLAETL